MEKIVWKDEYSVGLDKIDSQHQTLIGMINKLIDQQETLTDPKSNLDLLLAMSDYAMDHFTLEEKFMEKYDYDRIEQHVKQHLAFIDKTREFYEAKGADPGKLSNSILDYLGSWLIGHILREDMRLKPLLIGKGLLSAE